MVIASILVILLSKDKAFSISAITIGAMDTIAPCFFQVYTRTAIIVLSVVLMACLVKWKRGHPLEVPRKGVKKGAANRKGSVL